MSNETSPSSVTTPASGDAEQPINPRIVFVIVIVMNVVTIGAFIGFMKIRKVRVFGRLYAQYAIIVIMTLLIIALILLYRPCGRKKPMNFIILAICVILRFWLYLTFSGGLNSYIMLYGLMINLVICLLYLAVSFTSLSVSNWKTHVAIIITGYVTTVVIYFIQSIPSIVKPIRLEYVFFASGLAIFTPLNFVMQTEMVFERAVFKLTANDITLYISSIYIPFEDIIAKFFIAELVTNKWTRKCFSST